MPLQEAKQGSPRSFMSCFHGVNDPNGEIPCSCDNICTPQALNARVFEVSKVGAP